MDLFGRAACALTGHDWLYRVRYRVCAYCSKLERF